MRPLSLVTPKPLLEINSQSLLGYQIAFLQPHLESIAVTVGYMWEKVSREAILKGVDVVLLNKSAGNAAWLNNPFVRSLDTHVLVITSDNFMKISLEEIQAEIQEFKKYSFLITRPNDPELEGDRVLQDDGVVTSVSKIRQNGTLATGLQIINPSSLTPNKQFNDFHEVWNDLIDRNLLRVSKSQPEKWIAIDTPADLDESNAYFLSSQSHT